MTVVIIIFGVLVLLAGIVIVINPDVIFGFLRKHLDKLELYVLAIVIRLVLGGLLIYQSNISKFPLIIEILGWLSIVGAIVLAIIGRRNFKRMWSWVLSFGKAFYWISGVFASAFGAFLIYAFVA